jgi:tetratricopeptide (TPR) repeat protein
MKKNITIVLLVSINFLIAQNAETYYKQAQDFFEEKDYATALNTIENAIKLDATDVSFYHLKAESYEALGKVQESYNVYSEAILKFPKASLLYNKRGMLLYYGRQYDYAIEEITKAITIEANDTLKNEYLINRGAAKAQKRDYKGSYEDLIKAYKFNPKHIGALTNLGSVCDEVGRGDETLKYLLEAVAVDSTYFPAYGNIGFKYQEMGNHKKAIEYYNKVLELDPKEPLGYSNRSFNRLKLGDIKGAIADIEKSIILYPENSYAYRIRALIYIEMKNMNKACEDIQMALDKEFTLSYGNEMLDLKKKHCSD